MTLRDRVAVVGVGATKFGDHFDRSYYDLAQEAAGEALGMAGLETADVQAAWLGTCFPDMGGYEGNAGSSLADALGLFGIPISRNANYCATGMDAFRNACFAVAAGMYDRVLVVGVEKMRDVPSRESLVAQVVETGHPVHNKGLTAPGMFALCATAYFERWGVDRRLLAEVAVKNHAHGERNPKAHLRRRITTEQALQAPLIAEPLGLFDCCPQTDGAAAVVITRPELVGDRPFTLVKGIGLSVGSSDFPFFDPSFDFLGFKSTQQAARDAYRQAGIENPATEIHVAEVHDCFTITELLNYEDLGFCGRGEAARLIDEGITRIGGALPVNPSGGLKSCGHPIGASGVRMIYEITLQLLNRAEERQAGEPRVGLAHNLGGPGAVACVTVLGAPDGARQIAMPASFAAPAPLPIVESFDLPGGAIERAAEPLVEAEPLVSAEPLVEAEPLVAEPLFEAEPLVAEPLVEAEPLVAEPLVEAEPEALGDLAQSWSEADAPILAVELDAAQFFATASGWLRADAEIVEPLVLRFDLTGHRGGTWTLVIDADGIRIDPDNQRSAAILMASVEDFEAILGGRFSLQMAFMTGRMKIRGDMNAGMRIRTLFRLGEIPMRKPAQVEDKLEGRPAQLPQALRPGTAKLLGDVTRAFLPDLSSQFQPETSRFLEPPPESHTAGAGPSPAEVSQPPATRSVDVPPNPERAAAQDEGDDLMDEPSVDDVFASLPDRFDAEAADAAGASVVYHIAIAGPEQDDWSISIQDGELTVEPGKPLAPDSMLIMSAADWAALVSGRLSDKSGILTGRIKVRGSKPEAMLLKTYFRFGPLA